MPIDVRQVHARSVEGFQAAYAEETAAYQRAALAGDLDEAARAAQALAGLRATMRELETLANEAMTPRQQPLAGAEDLSHRDVQLARHYGLTAQEIGVAKGWTNNPDLSDEDKVRQYVENRQRYRHMRATGEYRDDQGKVTR
ncbi:hypothetical protein QMZ05_24605 [Bradyrhizobium sp. INPA03-11B]|uniref:hypothetical protein n=1 Tax=Bradyrhizobium sp. INPA03-11B TaxID=418598 RepID=UPI00338D76A3